jgi:phage baseplate assembly protein W
MSGMNRETGRLLDGWPHVVQWILVLFSTGFGERTLRRWSGSLVPLLLGNSLTARNVTSFFNAIATALTLWEPRFRLTRITPRKAERLGTLTIDITGIYFLRGHLGDFTPEDVRTISFGNPVSGRVVSDQGGG